MDHPKFSRAKSAFAMTCKVQIGIRATAEIVWAILTDAQSFPRWNSTVAGMEGRIREGERLKIRAPGTKRVFTPTVSGVVPGRRMVWSDGVSGVFKGVRIFLVTPGTDASVEFSMEEHFSGVMFALAKRALPDFLPIFEAYAIDLKREAERLAAG